MSMFQAMHSFRNDAEAVKGKKVERALVRRVLGLARPYRGQLIGFVVTVILAAVVERAASAHPPCPHRHRDPRQGPPTSSRSSRAPRCCSRS